MLVVRSGLRRKQRALSTVLDKRLFETDRREPLPSAAVVAACWSDGEPPSSILHICHRNGGRRRGYHRCAWIGGGGDDDRGHCRLRRFDARRGAASDSDAPLLDNGDACYARAMEALRRAEREEAEMHERRLAEQVAAADARSADRAAGVAVVRTVAAQARDDAAVPASRDDLEREARRWLERAAFAHGHAKARVRLGNAKLEDARSAADDDAADALARSALELYESADCAEGWFNAGHLRWTGLPGTSLRPDEERAAEAFERAVDAGDADALYFTGARFLDADDRETRKRGLARVERAAEEFGHGGALHHLALLRLNGDAELSVPPGSDDAFRGTLDQAADEAGHPEALHLRGHCRLRGDQGYPRDDVASARDLEAAAAAGHADAAVSAGALRYARGDLEGAFDLYRTAAEAGSREGWRNLVRCHALGEGVPRNEKLARHIAETMLRDDEDEDEHDK